MNAENIAVKTTAGHREAVDQNEGETSPCGIDLSVGVRVNGKE